MPAYSFKIRLGISIVAGVGLVSCAPLPSLSIMSGTPAPAKSPSPAITPEAQGLLAQAEKDVQVARERFALWTSAETALKQAWEAALAGDSPRVIQHAQRASEQVRAGLAQLAYPGTELK
jgi:hypothetical protein